MTSRWRRILAAAGRSIKDVEVGDLVRQIGVRGVGVVEGIANGHATVAWDKDRRDILPLAAIRKVPPKGHDFDRRG